MELIRGLRDEVLKKVQIVCNVVERKTTMPILLNVLLQKNGQTLQLLATDTEIQVQTQLHMNGLQEEDQIETTVSARKLVDVLRSLPENAEVVVTHDAKKVLVTSKRSRFSLQCLPAEGFPRVQEPSEWLGNVSIPQKILKRLLSQIHFSMAVQNVRACLNGVLLKIDADKITAVATDIHRLSYAHASGLNHLQSHEVIVPRKAVLELLRMLEDSDEPVHINLASNQARFMFNGIGLITKLIEDRFLDYQRVLSSEFLHPISLDSALLVQALQRVSILGAVEKIRSVRWALSNNILRLSCQNTDQEESEEELEVVYAGPEFSAGFNVAYLLDVLNNVKSEIMQFSFNPNNSSILFATSEQEDFKYIVMPMRM